MPSLSVLAVPGGVDSKEISGAFAALTLRSSFTLEKFQAFRCGQDDATELLRLMPSLTHLEIPLSCFSNRASFWFCYYHLIPGLRELILSELDPLNADIIIDIIGTRWWPGPTSWRVHNKVSISRLRRLSLTWLDYKWHSVPLDQYLLDRLEQYRQEGLEVTFD